MSDERWSAVDEYIEDRLIAPREAPKRALAANQAAGLAAIDVSPAQGKLLHLLVRMTGARRILEIGTLGGYSTIWMASALPADGLIVTIEVDPRTAEVARENFAAAGLAGRVDLRLGAALDVLPRLEGPFDLVFIDADKANNANYASWAVKLARPGTVIVCDNVVREGRLLGDDGDPDVEGTRALFDLLGSEPRLSATAIQTVGRKGWDGFAIAVVD
ncbi:MAG TPA: O-methyltransferase [Allosphingosinicella sp.]